MARYRRSSVNCLARKIIEDFLILNQMDFAYRRETTARAQNRALVRGSQLLIHRWMKDQILFKFKSVN